MQLDEMTNSTGPYCPLLEKMRETTSTGKMKHHLVLVCIHGLVSCLGILENALILWVVGFRLRRRTVASVWVLNLAMSDFLATLTLPLFTLYLNSSNSWDLGSALCSAQASIFFLNMFVSAYLLAAISLDRCLLVAKPVWSQNRRTVAAAWKVSAVGWLWAAINTIPYFMFRSVMSRKDHRKLCYHNFALYTTSNATLDRDCTVRQAATAISKLILAFLGPLVVIAGSYILFGLSLKKRQQRRKDSTHKLTTTLVMTDAGSKTAQAKNGAKTTNMADKSRTPTPTTNLTPNSLLPSPSSSRATRGMWSQSFTKMVTSVITAFVLCWAPYHIFCLIEVIPPYRAGLMEQGLPLATTIAFLNPVLNPILYAFSCPHFCERIQQSVGALFEGLLEEGGGINLVPGRSRSRGGPRRGSSRDGSSSVPGSPTRGCSREEHRLQVRGPPSSPLPQHPVPPGSPRGGQRDHGKQFEDDWD